MKFNLRSFAENLGSSSILFLEFGSMRDKPVFYKLLLHIVLDSSIIFFLQAIKKKITMSIIGSGSIYQGLCVNWVTIGSTEIKNLYELQEHSVSVY